MNWFLYDREVCHERVDRKTELSFRQKKIIVRTILIDLPKDFESIQHDSVIPD